jgi:hypothetical protein
VTEVELPNPDELEEKRGKAFTRRVALTTAIYAVVLAIAALGGNNATKEMLLAQQQASDLWAFYQAKAIREHQYRTQKIRLEADLDERGPAMKAEGRKRYEALRAKLAEEEKRYNEEKREIEKEAKKLEHERDLNRTKDPYFDFAEALLQIAIVMSSVSILSSSRFTFVFSLILAILGTVLTLNGYIVFVRVPFLHGSH